MLFVFSLKMLCAQRARLATALLGVIFALVLVNIQAGLFIGLLNKAGLLVETAAADLWIGHSKMNNVDFPRDIPRDWGNLIATKQGVEWSRPLTLGASQMTMADGRFETVLVVGLPRQQFANGELECKEGASLAVLEPDGIAVDQCEDYKLDHPILGSQREIGGKRVVVKAKTYGATSFLVTPYIFTTDAKARELLAGSDRSCSYILVKAVDNSPEGIQRLKSNLQELLPESNVLTGAEYAARSKWFWLTRTGLGISFGASTLLGLVVGLIVAGQAIYSIALDRVTEFAAMKAMGAGQRKLFAILVAQSGAISTIGCTLGFLITLALTSLASTPTAPIHLPIWLLTSSALGLCAVCTAACMIPFARLRKVDPLLVLGS